MQELSLTICVWSPGLSQIFGQLLDHSHREIFPLTSVLQDHRTWVSPVCLEPNDLGVHLILKTFPLNGVAKMKGGSKTMPALMIVIGAKNTQLCQADCLLAAMKL